MKFEIVLATISFVSIFLAGVAGHLVVLAGGDPKTVDVIVKAAILALFCFFGFSCIGLMLHVFTVLQTGIGNANAPLIRFLTQHETGVTFAVWGFLGLGALVAMPFALQEAGFHLPLRSQGILVADIGMTIDDVKARSTIKMPDPRHMADGSRLGVQDMVFEFRIGDSSVRFPLSRYYWIEAPKEDSRVSMLNIGITPRKMPKPDLDAFQHAAQAQLFANGWMPGHYVADSEETVRLWGGKRTTQDGRYWLRGNTVLSFERKRMDDEKPDEPPDSGEFIVDIHLEPKGRNRDLVFEPSAWTPRQQ
ncbi:MAG TPA: hypothetical protein VKU01_00415 [Bryobacteraceae bacterium]|nr:hypothetical protein [Bryobacteraceae bacterium]